MVHRSHWRVYVIGSVPLHEPRLDVSVAPTVGVPEIAGGAVDFGAVGVGVAPAFETLTLTDADDERPSDMTTTFFSVCPPFASPVVSSTPASPL